MKKRNKVHSVKYNFIMNFILTASSFIFPLITFPYASRILHTSGYGKVNFAASVANYFLMVASLGIPTYGIKACARVRDDKEKLSQTVQEILLINLVATVLTTVTYIICVISIPRFSQDKTLFFIQGINIVLNLFGANWLYQALEKYDYITIRSIIFKCISIVLMFLFVHQEADYKKYALITVLAAVGSNVLNFIKLHEYITFQVFNKYDFKQHIKPILILFAQNATVSIYTNLDTVMLGFLKGDTEVGLYTAAVKVKGMLLSFVTSLGNVLLPRMAYYVSKGKEAQKKFDELMIKAFNAVLFMALPLCTYFIFETKDSLQFLAGKEYLGAVLAMQIITIAVIPNGLTGVIGVQVLTPLNKEHFVLYSVIVGAASDFALNLILIPAYGATGASLATMIAEFLVLIVQVILGWEIISLAIKNTKIRYFVFSAISLIPLIFLKKVLLVDNSFFNLVLTAVVYFGLYLIELIISRDELLQKILENRVTNKILNKSR